MPKWPSGAFGTRPRRPRPPARPPRLTGGPQLAPRPGWSEVLAGYLPAKTARCPARPRRGAPSVLGVCGWVSAPRTALPRVYRPLVCSLGVSALPRRVVRRTTMPRVTPQSLSTRPTCAPGGAGRPHGPYPSPTSPRSPHRATPLSRKRSLHPRTPLALGRAPAFDTAQPPRHDDARDVHAGRSWGGLTVRCDRPRSQGHRLGAVFASSHSNR